MRNLMFSTGNDMKQPATRSANFKRTIVLFMLGSLWVPPTQSFQAPRPYYQNHASGLLSSVTLRMNVATEFLKHDHDHADEKLPKQQLSRPERKALERSKKQQAEEPAKRRKHNFKARKEVLEPGRQPGEGRYDLHSKAVSELCPNSSTADDVMRAIKRAQNLHDIHDLIAIERFLFEQTDEHFAYGFRGSLLARLAVAALHTNELVLAEKALKVRREEHAETRLPMESAAIIRGFLRVHNVTDALNIFEEELSLPETMDFSVVTDEHDTAAQDKLAALKDLVKHRALALASIASRHFFEGEPFMAVSACAQIAAMGSVVREAGLQPSEVNMPWTRLLRGASQCQSQIRDGTVKIKSWDENPHAAALSPTKRVEKLPCNVVYSVLNAMTTFPQENDDQVYEMLANALVRRVVFVTGAVDYDGLPDADRGEVAFIGRSNVGKSSLINMITNRKSLAYTSKRPGKTQQLNFFAVNDKVGREKEIKYGDVVEGHKDLDSFYIVDLPGFGYAKVPEQQRQKWLEFMLEYLSQRKTLKVVFHLIDSRHGPTEEDGSIMKEVSQYLPNSVSYVVILTKADKNVKGAAARQTRGKVSSNVMDSVRNTMKESGIANAPILLTSAETKLGRDDLWRYLRLAAEA